MPNHNGLFSTISAWNELRNKKREVMWAYLNWHKKHITRHTIIIWLAIKLRLLTRDELFGIVNDATCVLRNNHGESLNHLFFFCDLSQRVWEVILEKCCLNYSATDWPRYIDEIASKW